MNSCEGKPRISDVQILTFTQFGDVVTMRPLIAAGGRAPPQSKITSKQVKDDQEQQGVLNVTNQLTRALVVAFSFLSIVPATNLMAQGSAGQTGTRIAVVDISYIFKNHPGFKQQMEQMKTEVQAFEEKLRARGEQIKALTEQMKAFKSNSPEYKDKEAQILKIQADGQAAATLKKKEFLEKESQIYYSTYNQVVAEIRNFAMRHNIGLVVRFNSEEINSEDRASVLEGINRAVVFQHKLNITSLILESINRNAVAAQPGAATRK